MSFTSSLTSSIKGSAVNTDKPKIVAVDGPAGSGKSSICNRVSELIGWTYINTGAIYRAIGILAVAEGIDLDDTPSLVSLVDRVSSKLRWDSIKRELWCGDLHLTPMLNSEQTGYAASKIASKGLVRERLLPVQRQLTLSAPVGALVDGRDIGTVVFPDADLKIFLTASLEERSRRRQLQLGSESEELEAIKSGIAKRDERDQGRESAPLKQASDAYVLDTSEMSMDASVEAMIEILKSRQLI